VPAKIRAPRPRLRAAVAASLALALAASACAGSDDAAPGKERSTFTRATGATLGVDKPMATVSGLVAPAGKAPWTIVGSLYDPSAGAPVAAVWTAPDGRKWTRTTVHPAHRHTGESMAAAVRTQDGLLAVGRMGDGEASDAVVWRQSGGKWREIRPAAMGGPHEQWAFDVVTGPKGMLVAGGENVWGEVRPRLWFSSDGETFKAVDGGPGGPLDATGDEAVRDIVATQAGFVAVGSRNVNNEQDGLAWFSPDGTTWKQVAAPALGGAGRQELLSVANTGKGLVAGGYAEPLGSAAPALPAVWTSPDGQRWTKVPGALPINKDPRTTAVDLSIRSLSVDAGGLVAAGGNEWRPHVWRSRNGGATWNVMPNPVHGGLFQDGVLLNDAAASNGVAVAIGGGPAVLTMRSRWEDSTTRAFPKGGKQPFTTSVAERDGVTIAAGGHFSAASGATRERYTGQVWRRDGAGWDAIKSDPLSPGQVNDVVPFKGGFAAVGFEDFGLAATRKPVGDDLPDGIAWVSPDGKKWTRIGAEHPRIGDGDLTYIPDPDPAQAQTIAEIEAAAPMVSVAPAGGPGTRELRAVAPVGKGFVAVGTAYNAGDANPIVVSSPDGKKLVGEKVPIGGPGVQMFNDVCAGPKGTAVAVGVSGLAGSYNATLARRSAEGTWQVARPADKSFSGPGDQFVYACAGSKDGYVVVGSDDRSGDTDARVWTSPDGLTWTQVSAGPLGGSGDQWASAVAAAPKGGWLVGGTDTSKGDGDIALWRITAGGDVSRRDRGERELGGAGEQSVTGITVDDKGHVLLAGDDFGRAGLWESTVLDR
jgi:hypothetical protein